MQRTLLWQLVQIYKPLCTVPFATSPAMSVHKTRDRTPEIKAAGKTVPRGDGAKQCMVSDEVRPLTPERVKRFANATRPQPGEKRVLPAFARDSPPNPDLRHGVTTRSSLEAGELMNPPSKTLYQQQLLNQQESLYQSRQRAPLGSSHDQSPGLPMGMDLMKTTFGRKVEKEDSAAAVVSPSKTQGELEREYEEGRELYRKSHNAWRVGEMIDRDYDWSVYKRDSLYGVPTPHDNSGSQVKGALHWMHQEQSTKKTPIVSKRLDEFRERTQPQLGKVHDPIADTLDVDKAHTFGVMVQPDDLNAGELMHMEGDTMYSQCQGYDPGIMSTIRYHLKKNHFCNFQQLLDAFQNTDKDGTGCLSADELSEICFQFNLPLSPDQLALLMRWCYEGVEVGQGDGEGGGGKVNYCELLELMNWQHSLPVELERRMEEKNSKSLSPSHPISPPSAYRTSSQVVQVVGGASSGHTHTFGVPTIRSDLPAPRIRRVGDSTNYGDESDAYGLMYPSLYSNRGVFERDFFLPRNPEQVKRIFENVGVEMTEEVFQELWKEAASRDPRGKVSVESFRTLLEEVQAKQQLPPLTST